MSEKIGTVHNEEEHESEEEAKRSRITGRVENEKNRGMDNEVTHSQPTGRVQNEKDHDFDSETERPPEEIGRINNESK